MLDVRTVGLSPTLIPYPDGWALQREVHAGVVDGSRPDTLLLLEHEPVFTAGARTARHERPTDGTPVVAGDRGGTIAWRGPGQLVRQGSGPVSVISRRTESGIVQSTESFCGT